MLVLTRRIEESVVVGDHASVREMVKVTVLAITGGRVRLGFEVADETPVHRWEVWQRIRGKKLLDKPASGAAAPIVLRSEFEHLSGRS